MRKKKIKLNAEQKKILIHLEWFIENKIIWVGEQDLREAVADGGWFAVFSIRGEPHEIYAKHWTTECFNCLVMANDREGAMAILKWNPSSHVLAINLKWFALVEERRRPYSPESFLPEELM